MFDDKDTGFISKFITDSLEGEAEIARLLNLLNERIPISSVNYWVIKKDVLTSDYTCLTYTYQKSFADMFRLSDSKELCWSSAKANIHCITCLKTIQNLMCRETSCYEVHEHSGGVQAVKVDLSDQLTGSRVIYSFQFSMIEQEIKPSDSLVLQCLLPILFHRARLVSYSGNKTLLSKREITVLEWIKQGKSTWDISQVLSIAERTVNFHVKNIYQKLGVVSRAQAVAVAIDMGLIHSSVLSSETVCID